MTRPRDRRVPAPGRRVPPRDRRVPPPGRPSALGGEQVEGRQAVAELLAAGRRRALDVWIDDGVRPAPVLERIVALAGQRRTPVRRVPRGRLEAEARTEAPQGVLAHAHGVPEADVEELYRVGAPGGPPPFLLAVDGVSDPRNLGALLRTAEAAGVSGALLPRHRAAHLTPAATKAAAGAVEHVPMAVVGGMASALARATERGLWVVGLEAGSDASLFDLTVGDQPLVIVLGAEDKGLSRLVRQRCDVVVGIPQQGRLSSLNVAAAGALALFEVARARRPGRRSRP